MHPVPRRTAPRAPITCHSNASCYAHPLADCSQEITREHFPSRSVLESVARGGQLATSGYRFQRPTEVKALSPDAICSKVLCDRHNSALSGIDEVAGHFSDALLEILRLKPTDSGPHHRQFCGHDLEKWLLKNLFGTISSGNLKIGDGFAEKGSVLPPRFLLELLFSDAIMLPPWGLYARADALGEGTSRTLPELGGRVLLDTDHQAITGFATRINSYDLILWIDPIRRPLRMNLQPSIYRPAFIKTQLDHIELRWMGTWTDMALNRRVSSDPEGPRNLPWGHPSQS